MPHDDNSSICSLVCNILGMMAIIYSCKGISDLTSTYFSSTPDEQQECMPYYIWKLGFMAHIIFFFMCVIFSISTASSYLDDEPEDIQGMNPSEYIWRLKFEKMIENSLDVVRVFCMVFCGPFILIECILSFVYYKSIVSDCKDVIYDSTTGMVIYIAILFCLISLAVTGFCGYLIYYIGKVIKDNWSEIM